VEDSYFNIWLLTTEEYSTRKLSFQTDLLPALSGLADVPGLRQEFWVQFDVVNSYEDSFSKEEAAKKRLYCLPILLIKNLRTEIWASEAGIVLVMEENRLAYRRVGIFYCDPQVIDPQQIETVVIV
jgi:hypothetical protein